MSTSLTYWTTDNVDAEIRTAILREAKAFSAGRRWWCESLNFFDWPGKKGKLAGSTKVLLGETGINDDLNMSDYDALAIVRQLCRWSAEHELCWELEFADQAIGAISHGKPDRSLAGYLKGVEKSLGPVRTREKRVEAIHATNRDTPKPKGLSTKEIKAIRVRWTQAQITKIDREICPGKQRPPRSIKREKLGLVDGKYLDLRGFPINRLCYIKDRCLDFSFGTQAHRSVHGRGQHPRLRIE